MPDKTHELVAESKGPILVVTFNRPHMRNAVTVSMMRALDSAIKGIRPDGGIRAVLVRGAGGHFCSGLDLSPLRDAPDPVPYMTEILDNLDMGILALHRCPVPVIGALQGTVLGGGLGLALGCDLRIAAEGTRLSPGYYGRGLSMAGGMSLALPALVGPSRARDMALAGRELDAKRALEWGLVNIVVPVADLEDGAMEWAEMVANGPTQAVVRSKALMSSWGADDLESAMAAEKRAFIECLATRDFRDNLRRFFSKEKSEFSGK